MSECLKVSEMLRAEDIHSTVINMHTIKPIDKEMIKNHVHEKKLIVTVEEHQIRAGMGSAVAELLAREHPTKMTFIGVNDQFGQSGTPEELIEHYGMDVETIKEAARKFL